MILQISSGNGPVECELAVGKFLSILKKELPEMEIIDERKTKYVDCYKSVVISTNQDVSYLEGTIKWIVQSPFRPKHKRKNWFIDISIFDEKNSIPAEKNNTNFSENLVRFQTFRCGGHGGQNVNKVETGVRAIHIPTGISVTAKEARTQHLNKKIALKRLGDIIFQQNIDSENLMKQTMWIQHEMLERGNPIRVYSGLDFKRIDS